jgi:hypothetical protein
VAAPEWSYLAVIGLPSPAREKPRLEPIDDGPVTVNWGAELSELNAWLTDSINSLDLLLQTKEGPIRKTAEADDGL